MKCKHSKGQRRSLRKFAKLLSYSMNRDTTGLKDLRLHHPPDGDAPGPEIGLWPYISAVILATGVRDVDFHGKMSAPIAPTGKHLRTLPVATLPYKRILVSKGLYSHDLGTLVSRRSRGLYLA